MKVIKRIESGPKIVISKPFCPEDLFFFLRAPQNWEKMKPFCPEDLPFFFGDHFKTGENNVSIITPKHEQ